MAEENKSTEDTTAEMYEYLTDSEKADEFRRAAASDARNIFNAVNGLYTIVTNGLAELSARIDELSKRIDAQRDAIELIGQLQQQVNDEAAQAKEQLQGLMADPRKAIKALMTGKGLF